MVQPTRRDQSYHKSLGTPTNALVKEARILMVGAGGIGCELLKNLVLTGFGDIHIVDLDTIDLSNLNRQFLFRHEHIKKSKALVAKEAAHAFNPDVKIEAHHANIKDPQFNVAWFKGFTMVFNALDNLEARRHVNRMCLAADIPLIESGTTGFNGQVQVIKKGVTACYDCTAKETPKSFPVCTIRSTPSQPIHCIVWGKSYLLTEIFGASEEELAQIDNSEDSENAKEIEKLRQEAEALKNIRESMGTSAFPQLLFDKVYQDDINRLRSMEEMWKTRRPPQPLSYAGIIEQKTGSQRTTEEILKDGQRVWTLEENMVVFKDSLDRLSKRMESMKAAANGDSAQPVITFDKDDEDTLDFVTASANLRSIVFGIECKSRFDIKQMAGNIIPAIATTNAIVAGLCVLQSFKVLRGDYSVVKETYLSPFASQRLLASDVSRPPNPDCPVCSVAYTSLLVDTTRATLGNLVEDFLRLELGYGEEIVVNKGSDLLYDVEETENLTKTFGELGIGGDTFLTIIDEDDDNPRVNLELIVQESTTVDGKPIQAVNFPPPVSAPTDGSESQEPQSPIPRKKPSSSSNRNGVHAAEPSVTNGNGNVSEPSGSSPIKKRTISQVEEAEHQAKRSKLQTAVPDDDDIIIVEDTDGAIVIDDD
ncbi:hypothetical protein HYALB_00013686 [Hymenoscyphus albidus]|uniref:Ubiquitin-activating enzyme E1-like n=1 Tax=Hymenoscyphus albidus TaxID=595503 RepID=A0A9N9LZL1_9HELO|nr:hypothetical protein HYALB_00013686 [Hymenoscyphus albidus]